MSSLAPVYQCDLCSLTNESVIALQQHIMSKHPGVIRDTVAFECTKCGVLFYSVDFYCEHFKIHEDQQMAPANPTDGRKTTEKGKGKGLRSKTAGGSNAAKTAPQHGSGTASKVKVIHPMCSTPVKIISIVSLSLDISVNFFHRIFISSSFYFVL
ncbi:unnamed protein product [Orchesella dallaii]|uniref:C2H2-type domain-containing protein n=1 Tax=Orchesella dallaii TaxID=48710 RepID=A0ABP1S4X5_9HEXA